MRVVPVNTAAIIVSCCGCQEQALQDAEERAMKITRRLQAAETELSELQHDNAQLLRQNEFLKENLREMVRERCAVPTA